MEAPQELSFPFRITDTVTGNSAEVTLTVPAGSSSASLYLDRLPNWTWEPNRAYTIEEVSPSPMWKASWEGGTETETGIRFLFREGRVLSLSCTNQLYNWTVEVTKQDKADAARLPGAVFALYTSDASGAMSDEAYAALAHKPSREETAEGTHWYLSAVAVSGSDGTLVFPNLTQETYRLVEWKAPDGYYPGVPQLVTRDGETVRLTVLNEKGFSLPETGGIGTDSFRMGGLALAACALGGLIYKKHRKERE